MRLLLWRGLSYQRLYQNTTKRITKLRVPYLYISQHLRCAQYLSLMHSVPEITFYVRNPYRESLYGFPIRNVENRDSCHFRWAQKFQPLFPNLEPPYTLTKPHKNKNILWEELSNVETRKDMTPNVSQTLNLHNSWMVHLWFSIDFRIGDPYRESLQGIPTTVSHSSVSYTNQWYSSKVRIPGKVQISRFQTNINERENFISSNGRVRSMRTSWSTRTKRQKLIRDTLGDASLTAEHSTFRDLKTYRHLIYWIAELRVVGS